MPPFIVYALPRSRTAWVSAFLTYGDWVCTHEQAVTMRTFDDVRAFFARPNSGSAETAVSPGWQLIRHVCPDIREVVIHRPVDEVVQSFRDIDVSSVATYDFAKLHRNLSHYARGLRAIAARPGVLSIEYAELETEDACRRIFEHCLPYAFDRDWWLKLKDQNIQIDVVGHLRYAYEHWDAIQSFKHECKVVLRSLARSGVLRKELVDA